MALFFFLGCSNRLKISPWCFRSPTCSGCETGHWGWNMETGTDQLAESLKFKFHELMRALWSSEKTEFMQEAESLVPMQSLFFQILLIHCKTNSLCWKLISWNISGRSGIFYAITSSPEETRPELKWFTHRKVHGVIRVWTQKSSRDTLACLINQKEQCFCASILIQEIWV